MVESHSSGVEAVRRTDRQLCKQNAICSVELLFDTLCRLMRYRSGLEPPERTAPWYEDITHDTTLNNYGTFVFDGAKTGNAYADFLLGQLRRFNRTHRCSSCRTTTDFTAS